MFDYNTLIDRVRRLIGDTSSVYMETTDSLSSSSYYLELEEDGYATIDKLTIDDVSVDSSLYTIEKNILEFVTALDAGSSIFVKYKLTKYSDDEILDFIDDTIFNFIQPYLNIDFGFVETETEEDVDFAYQGLIVVGTVLNIMGVDLNSASSDSIYIKDGDTTINTAVSSQETLKNYKPMVERFNNLLKTVRINKFHGVVVEG